MTEEVINSQIRLRLRNLRMARKMTVEAIAKRSGLTRSCYSAIENGYVRVNVDRLYRILGALEADINDVWPHEGLGEALSSEKLYELRRQDFRIDELRLIFNADRAALFYLDHNKSQVLLRSNLSEEVAVRIAFYLQDEFQNSAQANLFSCALDDREFALLLEDRKADFSETLIDFYLLSWAQLFSRDSSLREAAINRQLQP